MVCVCVQIYYYHNVKCRVEMFDKDLIMLQVSASVFLKKSSLQCALTAVQYAL